MRWHWRSFPIGSGMLHGIFYPVGVNDVCPPPHIVSIIFRTGETADHAFEVHVGTAGKTPDQQKDGREETIDTHHLSNPIFVQEKHRRESRTSRSLARYRMSQRTRRGFGRESGRRVRVTPLTRRRRARAGARTARPNEEHLKILIYQYNMAYWQNAYCHWHVYQKT